MERKRSVILTFLILTFYVIVEVQWAQASVTSSSCISGEFLNGSSGFFSSPKFPNNYPQYSRCTWNITVPSAYIIKISFHHFQLGPRWNGGAQLTITNVASTGGTLDGNSLPAPVYSVGNSIQVTFMSLSDQYSGFNASYSAITYESLCPNLMTLNDASGVITSPYYPRYYPDNQTCSWYITASKGNYIVFLIEDMYIKKCGAACTCDYLEIQNGLSSDGVSSARRCGYLYYVIYHVYHDILKVLFVSNRGGRWYRGFKATYTQVNYTSIPATCISGESLNGSSGFFSSPNFPKKYPQYSRCTWNITVPSGYIIKISFHHFQLGYTWRGGAQLTITNVASTGGTLDGDSPPAPVYSVGNSIQVTFISLANQYSGFKASYMAITYESLCPNLMTLNDTSGTITSPYYPREYGNNHTCSWQITASKGNYIVLIIEHMSIQWCGAACTCDYLEIQNGLSSDGVSSARRCGSYGDVIYYVYHDSLKVLFVSSRGGRYRGFKATYTQVNNASIPATCISGEFLTGSSGFFSSPNFPNFYPQYSRCTWNITVPSGYIIKISFLHFQLGSRWYGGAQLTITDVSSGVVKMDGHFHPYPMYSVGNSIQVTFTSRADQYPGFKASYTAITHESLCPNLMILNDTSGTITSPYYPLTYPDNQTCSWQIIASKGNYIVFIIENMYIPWCGADCTCDYLEIQNGLSSDGVSSARRCSRLRNVTYHVYNDSLKVLFVSTRGRRWYPTYRVHLNYRGFKATYTQVKYPTTPTILPTFSLLAVAETEAVVQLANRKTFSNGNTVRYFQIIVIPLKKGTGSGNHPEKIKRKYEDQEEGEPYITAEFLKDESRTTFTVGDDKYYSQFDLIEAVTKFLNGKLESNTQYAVFQRSFDEDGGYEDEGIVQFTTKAARFPTVIVVSVVIVVVLFSLPILSATFKDGRRIRRRSQNEMEMKTSLMNPQHCSTQEWMEMSANINTSIELS